MTMLLLIDSEGRNKMSKYSYLVCACSKYLPEVVTLLNSLDFVGNTHDVHFYGHEIPEDVIKQFDLLSYKLIFHNITEEEVLAAHGLSEVVCRKRYKFVDDLKDNYDAICVLDADMLFVRNPEQFFVIAEKTGYVLGVTKEQNQAYNDPHHMFKGEWVMPEGTCPEYDLCNCPLFIDPKIWGECLRVSFEMFIDGFDEMKGDNFKAPDMAAMNLMLLKHGSADKTIPLVNAQWLGTNEQLLKPYMRAVEDRKKIKCECGIPIFSIHGHIGHKVWRENQLENRSRCSQGYLKASGDSLLSNNNIAKGSLDLIYRRFKEMFVWKIKLQPYEYRHSNEDYKKEYGDLWG